MRLLILFESAVWYCDDIIFQRVLLRISATKSDQTDLERLDLERFDLEKNVVFEFDFDFSSSFFEKIKDFKRISIRLTFKMLCWISQKRLLIFFVFERIVHFSAKFKRTSILRQYRLWMTTHWRSVNKATSDEHEHVSSCCFKSNDCIVRSFSERTTYVNLLFLYE